MWRGLAAIAVGAVVVGQVYVLATALILAGASSGTAVRRPLPLLPVLTDLLPFVAVVALDAGLFGLGEVLSRRLGPASWLVPLFGSAALLALLAAQSPALFAALRLVP